MSDATTATRAVIQLQSPEGSCQSGGDFKFSAATRKIDDRFDICVQVSLDRDKEQVLQQLFDLSLCLADNWDDLTARARVQRQDAAEIMATSRWVGPRTGMEPDRLAMQLEQDGHAMVLLADRFHA